MSMEGKCMVNTVGMLVALTPVAFMVWLPVWTCTVLNMEITCSVTCSLHSSSAAHWYLGCTRSCGFWVTHLIHWVWMISVDKCPFIFYVHWQQIFSSYLKLFLGVMELVSYEFVEWRVFLGILASPVMLLRVLYGAMATFSILGLSATGPMVSPDYSLIFVSPRRFWDCPCVLDWFQLVWELQTSIEPMPTDILMSLSSFFVQVTSQACALAMYIL